MVQQRLLKMRKKVKLSDFEKHEVSPFSAKIKKRNKQIMSRRMGEAYNTFTGELMSDNVSLVISKAMDKTEFVKMFTSNIDLFFEISESEIKMFFYLISNMEINTGRARFNIHDCKKVTGYSKVSIYRALGLLCSDNFVARTLMTQYYWVNPSIAFNGSRMSIKAQ